MSFLILGAGLLLSLATTLALVFPVRWIARRRGWIDRPDGGRKLHASPTPTIGGLAIVGGFVVGVAFLTLLRNSLPFEVAAPAMGLCAGAAIIVAAGFYDDIRGLSFRQKFAVQVISAYFLIHAGYQIDLGSLAFIDDPYEEALYAVPLTILWIVGITNAVNLIDGLDGLATGIVYIGLSCLTLVFSLNGDSGLIVLALPLFGALAGFLIHNFNRASLFMGDSGSLFLGFMLAAASLHGSADAHPILSKAIPITILGLPVLDTLLCIARRWLNGRSMFAPDRDHIHHRMLKHSTPRKVVTKLYLVALGFGASAVLMKVLRPGLGITVLGITVVLTGFGVYRLGYLDALPTLIKRALEDVPPPSNEPPSPIARVESRPALQESFSALYQAPAPSIRPEEAESTGDGAGGTDDLNGRHPDNGRHADNGHHADDVQEVKDERTV